MSFPAICRLLERYLFAFCGFLLIPLILAIYDHFTRHHPRDGAAIFAFSTTILLVIALKYLFKWYAAQQEKLRPLLRKEALFCAALIWLITPFLGSLPYLLSGVLQNFTDALFEATSGFTTTGASICTAKLYEGEIEIPYERLVDGSHRAVRYWGNITPIQMGEVRLEGLAALPRALLFWRCFSQWLGGMGIIVLFVALAPLGGGSRLLFQSEVTGPTKEAITPRAKESASLLWKIYAFLTVAQITLLHLVEPQIPFFDSLTISLSTISTGGFTIFPQSIGLYQNPRIEWTILLFMVLGGLNFGLYPLIYRKKWRAIARDQELWLYLSSLLLGGLFLTLAMESPLRDLSGNWNSPSLISKMRTGLFHFVSSQTSTGFATHDFDLWSPLAKALLLLAMFLGGMAGSTAGGMKIARHWLLIRFSLHKLRKMLSPHTLTRFHLNGQHVSQELVGFVFVFFFLHLFFTTLSFLLFLSTGIDQASAFALSACTINNVGFSLALAGPSHTFAFLTPWAKVLSCFLMVLGRLEFFTLLLVFLPRFFSGKD